MIRTQMHLKVGLLDESSRLILRRKVLTPIFFFTFQPVECRYHMIYNFCFRCFLFQDRIGRRRTRAAMRHWQKHTCLKFKRVKNPPDNFGYIKFVFEGG